MATFVTGNFESEMEWYFQSGFSQGYRANKLLKIERSKEPNDLSTFFCLPP